MPLFLGRKRSHRQLSSDIEDHTDDVRSSTAGTSSPALATPSSHHVKTETPSDSRKSKQARYSMPSDSPSNIFRVDNNLLYQHLSSASTTLPSPVKTHLHLRVRTLLHHKSFDQNRPLPQFSFS
jgi:hypothetical protein